MVFHRIDDAKDHGILGQRGLDSAVLKRAVCLPFMFSRVVGKDRAARTVLVSAGKRSDSSNVKCELTNTPMKKEL